MLVGIAATNTGNNALYIVLALMLALLVVSGVVSRYNLRSLRSPSSAAGEIYARRPFPPARHAAQSQPLDAALAPGASR